MQKCIKIERICVQNPKVKGFQNRPENITQQVEEAWEDRGVVGEARTGRVA